jgi:hypothetical protein
LPLINSQQVELLDNSRMISQLCSLERRVGRGGRDSIDSPPGGSHDDVANCVAGVISFATATMKASGLLFTSVSVNAQSYAPDDFNPYSRPRGVKGLLF